MIEPEFTQPEYVERERTPEYVAALRLITTFTKFANRDREFLEKKTPVMSCSASEGSTEIIEGEAQLADGETVDVEYGFRARRHTPGPGVEYIGFELVIESEQQIDLVVHVMNDEDSNDDEVYKLKAKSRIRRLNFQIDNYDTELVFTEEFIYLDECRDVISNVSSERYDDEGMNYIVNADEADVEESGQESDEASEVVTLRQLASSAMKTRQAHEALVTEDTTLEEAMAKWVVEEEARNVLPESDVLGEINLAAVLFQRMVEKLQGLSSDSPL